MLNLKNCITLSSNPGFAISEAASAFPVIFHSFVDVSAGCQLAVYYP